MVFPFQVRCVASMWVLCLERVWGEGRVKRVRKRKKSGRPEKMKENQPERQTRTKKGRCSYGLVATAYTN